MIALLAVGCGPPDDGTVRAPPAPGIDTGTEPTVQTTIVTTPTGVAGISRAFAALDPDVPTVVTVSWEQAGPATVHAEYAFDGETRSSPPRELGPGAHTELLLGIPYGTAATWRLVAETADGTSASPERTVTIADLPLSMAEATVTVADPDAWDPSVAYLLLSVSNADRFSGQYWTILVDRQGRTVWGHESPVDRASMYPRPSRDGRSFLVDHNSYWGNFDGGVASTVLEMKIDGSIAKVWETPGLHHPFTDLPDGSLAYGRIYDRYEEALTIVDPSGHARDLFDCGAFLGLVGVDQTCASNTLWYSETDDVFLFSFWTLETVVEVDGQTGNPNRWFGHLPGAWGFSPPSSAFWYQHGGHYLANGNLLISSHADVDDHAIVAHEYVVDDGTEQLIEVWSFGEDDDLVGDDMGEVHRLDGGNTLSNYGTLGRLRESTPDGTVVWDVSWGDHTVGHSTVLTGSLYDYAPR